MARQRARDLDETAAARRTTQQHAPNTRDAAALFAVQRDAGNQAAANLIQRLPAGLATPTAPVRTVDDATATRDYADALSYVDDFYDGVHLCLEQVDKVRETAQDNYVRFGELEDPPDLAAAIAAAVFSSVLGMVPGGKLLSLALETGMFAHQLGRLKVELETAPIPGYSIEQAEREGPSQATTKKAAEYAGHADKVWSTGKAIYGAVTETLAKQKAAAAAEAKALELAGLSNARITDWSAGAALAQREELTVKGWLQAAGPNTGLRGVLRPTAERTLGPIPIVDKGMVGPLVAKYELELYRAKLKSSTYVATIFESGPWMQDSAPSRPELRPDGELSKATKRRIAACAGVPGTDDAAIAGVLGIPVTIERKRNPGLRRPGEM